MKTISILTPVRKRPENIFRMIESIKATQSQQNLIELVVRIDADDEVLNDPIFIRRLMESGRKDLLEIVMLLGPPTFPDLGTLWNDCCEYSKGDYLQMGGDDLIYRTLGWDQLVVDSFSKFPDEIVLVWAQDGGHNHVLATHGFVSRKWVQTTGWFTPRCGNTYANDDFIFAVGRETGRLCYLANCFIEHRRHFEGAENDPNYGRMMEHFQRSQEVLHGPVGRNIIDDAVSRLRSIMQ
jgi:hypothetical protein